MYFNSLIDKVDDGWIFFVDDDDTLNGPNTLNIINANVSDPSKMYIFRMNYDNRRIIPGVNFNKNIVVCDIATPNILIHKSKATLSKWPGKRMGDFAYISGLVDAMGKSSIVWVNKITYNVDLAGEGKRSDITYSKPVKIHTMHKVFGHIEVMLKSLYMNDPNYNNTVFVLGYNTLSENVESIRRKYPGYKIVTYQLEQLSEKTTWLNAAHIKFLRESDVVWDYDLDNIKYLQSEHGITTTFAPLKYVPELTTTTLLSEDSHDIDILFYGTVNDKRNAVIDDIKLKLPNKNVVVLKDAWNAQLDGYIERAKIVLNIHYYEVNRLEQARLFYLLANNRCVVSETSPINYYGDGMVMTDCNNIAAVCDALLETGKWREYSANACNALIESNRIYTQ